MGMFGPDPLARELKTEILGLRKDIANLKTEREAASEERRLTETIVELKTKVSDLTIEADKIQEDYDRQERETRHEVGLLRKQTEVETKLAKDEAILEVREENLTAERTRFEEQMKFTAKRFEREVVYLREIMAEIMKRLPTIEVDLSRSITDGPAKPNGHAEPD